jgi:hypothetical protein
MADMLCPVYWAHHYVARWRQAVQVWGDLVPSRMFLLKTPGARSRGFIINHNNIEFDRNAQSAGRSEAASILGLDQASTQLVMRGAHRQQSHLRTAERMPGCLEMQQEDRELNSFQRFDGRSPVSL